MNNPLSPKNQLDPNAVALVGIPCDENSSFMRGPVDAPERIRELLHNGSSNACAEDGTDLDSSPRFVDVGNLQLHNSANCIPQIESGITQLLNQDARVLSLGGDHAVTYPIVKAHARKYGNLNILHLDAHPDLYHEFEGNPFSHACPFARIMEEKLAIRLVQIGIRTLNPHQKAQAERFGVEIHQAKDWPPSGRTLESVLHFDGPVYLSLDMDVLDPAFAPGVSHHEPGGLSSREVLGIIQAVKAPIVGADIVELNPGRDPLGITGMAAVKFLKEIAAQMLKDS